jgi:hypothetical protein
MPYLTSKNRGKVDRAVQNEGILWVPTNAGDLNYFIACAIDNYIRANGKKYATLNEMIGALECAKLEIYRMLVAPYEDKKSEENGPVF